MSRSLQEKALEAVCDRRATVVKANATGIALDLESSKPDPRTLARATYRTLVWIEGGTIKRSCTCPALKRCYHIELAELLWRPGPHEGSSR